ncbi:hypothetical protein FM106_03815 [Brachybacterium faecium]|nr:hypothetical protein FM106_03815 [Brachybacterium faecium]
MLCINNTKQRSFLVYKSLSKNYKTSKSIHLTLADLECSIIDSLLK